VVLWSSGPGPPGWMCSSPFLCERYCVADGPPYGLASHFAVYVCVCVCMCGACRCTWSIGFSCAPQLHLDLQYFTGLQAVLFSDCVCVCACVRAHAVVGGKQRGRCVMSSLPGALPLARPGRGFSDLYARFVYFCRPGYSGWCVSLTHTPHIPHLFLVISRLFTLDLVVSFS